MKKEMRRIRIDKRHRRSGGNAGAAVNPQRIGAIFCHGLLARVGNKRQSVRIAARL
jgi:hypothetical protein